jgi:SAM-dependent methyltransferase
MSRLAIIPRVKRRLLAVLERLGLLVPSFRAYEALRSLRPVRPKATPDGLPLPPARLRVRVAGKADPAWFFESGRRSADTVGAALARQGVDLDHVTRLLDFGCGCGRVVRHWEAVRSTEFHGCDRDSEAVRWCADNLRFARFAAHGAAPPLPYADDFFAAACAVSVFTHLPEADQRLWVDELARALAPGALLVLTTHGEAYRARLAADEREAFDAGQLVVRFSAGVGTNLCTAFHPRASVERLFTGAFDLLEHVSEGATGTPNQDLVVAARRATA